MTKQDKIGVGVLIALFAVIFVLLALTFRSPGGGGPAGTPSDNPIVRHSVEKRQ